MQMQNAWHGPGHDMHDRQRKLDARQHHYIGPEGRNDIPPIAAERKGGGSVRPGSNAALKCTSVRA